MNEERKTEEFETEIKKWRVYFDIESDILEARVLLM